MKPWIENTLAELQAELDAAQKALTTADEAHTKAQQDLDAASAKRHALYHLLKDFREFANAEPEVQL